MRNLVTSDALCMLDVFRRWSNVGVADFSADVGDRDSSSDMSLCVASDCSSVVLSSVERTRLGKIRGESLRCMYLLIRVRADDLVGQWSSLVLDKNNTRLGLCSIALTDTDAYARRFALYCVVSLFRSETARKFISKRLFVSGGSGIGPSLLCEDIWAALPVIVSTVNAFLKFENSHDQSSISFVLSDFLKSVSWKTAGMENQLHECFQSLVNHHLQNNGSPIEECVWTRFLWALSVLVPQIALSTCEIDQLKTCLFRTPNISEHVLAINCVIQQVPCLGTHFSNLILDGLCLISKTSVPQSSFEAVLLNLSILPTTPPLEEFLVRLITGEQYPDSVLFGLGKLSRVSEQQTTQIFQLDMLPLIRKRGGTKWIQGVGDLLFSGIIYEIVVPVVDVLLSTLVAETLNTGQLEAASLRAIMTGLSRLNEHTSAVILRDGLLNEFQEVLLKVWSNPNEKILADSLRTIGLLHPLLRKTNCRTERFHCESKRHLTEGLKSGKTQRILSALYTISTSDCIEDWNESVTDMLKETCANVLNRKEWDFASVAPLVGMLHVIHNGLSLGSIDADLRKNLEILVNDNRFAKVIKYDPAIAKHIDTVRIQLLTLS